jgi:hypothetical protein
VTADPQRIIVYVPSYGIPRGELCPECGQPIYDPPCAHKPLDAQRILDAGGRLVPMALARPIFKPKRP